MGVKMQYGKLVIFTSYVDFNGRNQWRQIHVSPNIDFEVAGEVLLAFKNNNKNYTLRGEWQPHKIHL